jgi:putative salt-induced outer membrane protein YdiY
MRALVRRIPLLMFLPWTASAVAADDFVALSSGNRMTGEIERFSRGELFFSIDGAGTAAIDWRNIEALRSARIFDVELTSGERLKGEINSSSAGALEIRTGTSMRTIDIKEVVRIEPLHADFTDRMSGAIDLGFDFLTAHDEIDWTLNAEAAHRTLNYLTEASISSLLRRHDDETSQRRNHFEIGSRRLLENRWFVLGQFEAEEDLELELESRFLILGAVGRSLVQSNRTVLATYAGVDVSRERFSGTGTQHEPEVLVALEWDWFDAGADTEFSIEATSYFGLDESRTRFDLESSLRRDIFTNVYWSLNLYESYNSDPPEGLEKSDLGLSITIGRSF